MMRGDINDLAPQSCHCRCENPMMFHDCRAVATVNKYRFCISVIGYINIQIIGIGYKKSILVDH